MAERPILITIIGALTALVAIILLIAGVICLISSTFHMNFVNDIAKTIYDSLQTKNPPSLQDITNYISLETGIILVIVGFIYAIIAFGFLNGWSIVWYLGVIIYAISAISCIVMMFTTGAMSIVLLVISLVILYYLFRPKVKEFFEI